MGDGAVQTAGVPGCVQGGPQAGLRRGHRDQGDARGFQLAGVKGVELRLGPHEHQLVVSATSTQQVDVELLGRVPLLVPDERHERVVALKFEITVGALDDRPQRKPLVSANHVRHVHGCLHGTAGVLTHERVPSIMLRAAGF